MEIMSVRVVFGEDKFFVSKVLLEGKFKDELSLAQQHVVICDLSKLLAILNSAHTARKIEEGIEYEGSMKNLIYQGTGAIDKQREEVIPDVEWKQHLPRKDKE